MRVVPCVMGWPLKFLWSKTGSKGRRNRIRAVQPDEKDKRITMFGTILVILLVLMLLGSVPKWPHSRNWGYYPSGGLGLLLVVLIVLLVLGRL